MVLQFIKQLRERVQKLPRNQRAFVAVFLTLIPSLPLGLLSNYLEELGYDTAALILAWIFILVFNIAFFYFFHKGEE